MWCCGPARAPLRLILISYQSNRHLLKRYYHTTRYLTLNSFISSSRDRYVQVIVVITDATLFAWLAHPWHKLKWCLLKAITKWLKYFRQFIPKLGAWISAKLHLDRIFLAPFDPSSGRNERMKGALNPIDRLTFSNLGIPTQSLVNWLR